MKVHGFSDEHTSCDCCGKSNLRGTFTVETDAGEVLHYGSVCVNKMFGKREGATIRATGDAIARARALGWDKTLGRIALGHLHPLAAFIGSKPAWNNSSALLAQADSIRDCRTGVVVLTRPV